MTQPVHAFHRSLHQWYAAHGRKHLPWRNTVDPYAIYISETMLQQTQVKTVLERFYFPFLDRFPTLAALAKAQKDEVLQLWQGLGYYNRALNLHEAAKRAGKALPQTVEGLLALPGIGRNTAHAVAAFAYRQPVAVMEANVRRVLCRIFALARPTEIELWEKAGELLDRESPFDYNQAMMDIGATICTKRAPRCAECPASSICKGQSAPQDYPAMKAKKQVPVRRKKIAVLQNMRGEYYAVPRKSRFLQGLYHFVETEAESLTFGNQSHQLTKSRMVGGVRQQYSHFTLDAEVFLIQNISGSGKHWYRRAALEELPFSMAERKIIELISD